MLCLRTFASQIIPLILFCSLLYACTNKGGEPLVDTSDCSLDSLIGTSASGGQTSEQ